MSKTCILCHEDFIKRFKAATGEPSSMEEDMLDFAFDVRPNSRLSCQLKIKAEWDGLVVTTPEKQG